LKKTGVYPGIYYFILQTAQDLAFKQLNEVQNGVLKVKWSNNLSIFFESRAAKCKPLQMGCNR
jgi:hypothetical protein